MPAAAAGGRVQSLERAIALLGAVADVSPEGEPVAALASRCGLNRATAWRLLGTLEAHGLVDRDPATQRYAIGFAMSRLAASAGVEGLVRRAHPVLVRLSERTGETADLAVARPLGLTYVDEVAPPSVLAANWLGRQVPLHATSSGKALLAWLPDVEVSALLAERLTRLHPRDADLDQGAAGRPDPHPGARLRVLRRRAGAHVERGLGPGLDRGRRPVAVLSVWGPHERVPPARFAELGALTVAAAADVAAAVLA